MNSGDECARTTGGVRAALARIAWRKVFVAGAALAFVASASAYGVYRKALADVGPLSLDDGEGAVRDRRRSRRSPAARLHDGRRPLAPAARSEGRRPHYLKMLLVFEDRRFYDHHGVDPRALVRAVAQAVRHGRLVSGGSTLTMQVARLLDGKHERTAAGKLRQMILARQLERALSKQEILRLYLRLAPFGGNLEGVRAASLAYFGKEPRHLSMSEAALLVALPQSPESRRLDRRPKAAERARNRVLDVAVKAGAITRREAEKAKAERVPARARRFPDARAASRRKRGGARSQAETHRLTLDSALQASLEALVKQQAALQGDKLSAAIVVADHGTGEILAYVGSSDYLSAERQGAVDMASAVRSPGSTLKPFIYGLAFEAGFAHPETLIDDRPARFGNYAPKNFDEDYRGTVSMREALSQSLNIPAVRALARVGPGKLVGRLRRAGVMARFPDASEPSLAIALGGTGLTLIDVAQLYAALARGGDTVTLNWNVGARPQMAAQRRVASLVNARRMLSPLASWYVTDILKDAPPPLNAKGGRFAYKTGTSYGYRDAWAIGYDGRHVVAAWIGRPDGASVPGLMGRNAAAPILFDAFERISPNARRCPRRPRVRSPLRPPIYRRR